MTKLRGASKKMAAIYLRRTFLVVLLWLSAVVLRAQEKLNVFIYSEYLPPEVVSEFERRFQCKVVIDLYEDSEAMLAKIQSGGAALYDIVVPTDYVISAMVDQKLLAPLRLENIPNIKNLDSTFRNPPYDRDNKYSVAYQWGTLGIYARKSGRPMPQSWSVIFDASKQPGDFVLLDSMRDTIGAALKYRGWQINSTVPEQLKAARDLIVEAKKRSVGFANTVGGMNKVLEKSARAAMVFSGEAARAIVTDPDTYYFIPKEGSEIWVDNLSILAQAAHRDLAEKFINFILEPEIGAKISNKYQFATPNAAAKKFIKPELLNNPVIYPSREMMKTLEFLKDLGRDTRLYDQLWTSIKSR
jgi:spermidine/putrescine transport system substrate-binding protein